MAFDLFSIKHFLLAFCEVLINKTKKVEFLLFPKS